MTIRAILTDIEGTTTDIAFVHDQLFPYSVRMLPTYLHSHAEEPEVAAILAEVRQLEHCPDASLAVLIESLQRWIAEDRKITPLKTLQGYIWEYGYQTGELQGHLYTDAWEELKKWRQEGIKLYVYSSGSVKAQKLLFGKSIFGDLTSLFSGHFDTAIGAKKEADSYRKISQITKINPENFLFLSDVEAELEAARNAGMNAILLVRGQMPPATDFPTARNFVEVNRMID